MQKKSILLTLVMSITVLTSYGQVAKHYNIKKKVAINGYDPVSYFDTKPTEGEPQYSATHDGVTYYFSSSSNKSLFEKTPEKYVPQYGGWCAYAMGIDGSKVKIYPETYKIVSGKLYLFYNFNSTNTLKSWSEDEKELTVKANLYWSKIIN